MVLTEADMALLEYLHAVKISTFQRIRSEIYPDYHLKSVCNRVYRLENNSLVRGWCNRRIANGERLITLTKKGFYDYVATGDEQRIELGSEAPQHDLALSDIRNHLRKAERVLEYFTENQIQTWGKARFDQKLASLVELNSDGVAILGISDEEVLTPVEYEANLKSHDRYVSLINRYYRHDEVLLVIYVAATPEILNRVKQIEASIFPLDEPKITYCLLQDLQENPQLVLRNYHDHELLLNVS